VNTRTRAQLLELNRVFYEVHAEAFDQSRGARAWPGWQRLVAHLPAGARRDVGRVLDVGCGNGRFASFLHASGFRFDYTGVDANAALLEAARRRLPEDCAGSARWIRADFLAGEQPGADLPAGPFDVVVLMGVLHHVPGADWRLELLRAAAKRLAEGGVLALAAWQFAGDAREERKRIAFDAVGPLLGESLDPAQLEPGDALLRFGENPDAPPRYCHAIGDREFASWPAALRLECLADFHADGHRGESNRYALLRRP
jgi:SAM-dependent methyltransferase